MKKKTQKGKQYALGAWILGVPMIYSTLNAIGGGDGSAGIVILMAILGGIYFIPALYAYHNNKHNADQVAIVNFFTGWTFVGWVIAATMAAKNDK